MTSHPSSNNSSSGSGHIRLARDFLRSRPQLSQLFFELTTACNLHCRHCGSNSGACKHEELDIEAIGITLDQLRPTITDELPKIALTGGEPMMHPSFWTIVEMLSTRNLTWGMTSNATLIDQHAAQRLKAYGVSSISVSVDGLKDMHDWFRNQIGAFEHAVSGIRHLVSAGVPTDITTVVHKRNISSLSAMAPFVASLGPRAWRLVPIDPIGRARDCPDLFLNEAEMHELMSFISANRAAGTQPLLTTGCSHYLGKYEGMARSGSFFCGAGITVASIRANGDICACLDIPPTPQTIQGNIHNERLYDIWDNRFALFRTSKIARCGTCSNCEHVRACDGDSWHTWDFEADAPLICKRMW